MSSQSDITVRFKFKDHADIYGGVITMEQFENLNGLPSIEFCQKVRKLGKKVRKEAEKMIQRRLNQVLRSDSSHVKNLSYG